MTQDVRTAIEHLDRFAAALPIIATLSSSIAVLALVAFVVALAGFESMAHPLATAASALVVVAFAARAAQRAGLSIANVTNVLIPVDSVAKALLIGLLLILAGAFANWLTWSLAWAVSPVAREAVVLTSDRGTPLQLVSMVVLAPVAEEILFRYGIQRRLAARLRPVLAILVTGALFSCLHGPWIPEMIAAFVLSALTGAWAAGARPVGGAVSLHIGWNVSATLLLTGAVSTLQVVAG
jgi:membrane protease YdiL (CAAX protease family)